MDVREKDLAHPVLDEVDEVEAHLVFAWKSAPPSHRETWKARPGEPGGPVTYSTTSQDLNETRAAAGVASEILRMFAQVCL